VVPGERSNQNTIQKSEIGYHERGAKPVRETVLRSLPVRDDSLVIRSCERQDLDLLAGWPPYPKPYESFRFSFASFDRQEMDSLFERRFQRRDRITLVVDNPTEPAVGYVALQEIDWGDWQATCVPQKSTIAQPRNLPFLDRPL